MDQFVKVYGSIIRSTVWQTAPHVKLTWLTLLILADSQGRVEGSVPGLAATAGVSIEQCEQALALFMSPDKYSRTKDNEGRRLQEIDGGWLVLNHSKYRDLRTPQQVQKAERQRKWEEKKKAKGEPVRRRRSKTQPDAADARSDAPDAEQDASDTRPDAPDGQNVSAVRSRRSRRADPDPDPDPDPDLRGRSGRARAPEPAPAAPAAPAEAASPEYSRDEDPPPSLRERTWSLSTKPPSDYEPLEVHRVRALELGVDLAAEVLRFRTHEYPRAYSDWDRRFERWILDARRMNEREAFKAQQGRGGPRPAGLLQKQPSNGRTGWEHLDDDDESESGAAHG